MTNYKQNFNFLPQLVFEVVIAVERIPHSAWSRGVWTINTKQDLSQQHCK